MAADDEKAGVVRGTVIGKDGSLYGVLVRVVADGKEIAACRTDFEGRYRLEAEVPKDAALEAAPDFWTELDPVRRPLAVAPGTEVVEDFLLGDTAGASGRVQGPAAGRAVTLFAIRQEDYPEAPDIAVHDLRRIRNRRAEARGTFSFTGLDPDATYRIAVDGYEWGLERPVLLKAGDTGVGVPLERLLRFVVEAHDIEGGAPLARFRARVLDRDRKVHAEIDGRDGRLSHRVRHPEQVPPDPPLPDPDELRRIVRERRFDQWPTLTPWTISVEAEGYLAETRPSSGMQRVYLQRVRKANVLLLVNDEAGAPIDGELEGTFEAAKAPQGFADAHVVREGPGRYLAVLPPGTWRLAIRGSVHFDVIVPEEGMVTVEPPPLSR